MQYRQLGNTDLEVSPVAFGCWAIIGGFNWGPQDEQESLAALRAAYDAGINFFDTAEMYGDGYSEQLLGRALGDVRDRIVIASKAAAEHLGADDLRAACERSLRNLKTDRIDLYQLHWPNCDVPLAESLGALAELQQAGKIRYAAVSNFGVGDLRACLETAAVASNQLAYNLLFRAIEFELLPLCRSAEVPVLCYCPIAQGLLAGKFAAADDVPGDRARTRNFASTRPHTRHTEAGAEEETFAAIARVRAIADELGEPMARVSLAWILAQAGIGAVIVGGRNVGQARRNAQAADLVLAPEVIARLSAATASLKEALGPNPDLWQTDSRVR